MLSLLHWKLLHCHPAESPPVISPAGYNTSVNDDLAVEFRCKVALDAEIIVWRVNGESIENLNEEYIRTHGIETGSRFIFENETKFSVFKIAARTTNNNTSIQCGVLYSDFSGDVSEMVIFKVQGMYI